MTKSQSPGSTPLRFQRRFAVASDLVYAAWTKPELIKLWLHPGPQWSNPVVDFDPQIGGAYRLGFQNPEMPGVVFVVGKFIEVEPGVRLVYTWTWEPPDPHAGIETLVTVVFADVDGGTEVSVTHERFPNDEVRERHNEGWKGTMDCLADSLRDLRMLSRVRGDQHRGR